MKKDRISNIIPFAIYFGLSLIILIYFLNKYIFLLDWVYQSNIYVKSFTFYLKDLNQSKIFIELINKSLGSLIPIEFIQKLIILLIFFLSGISMHNLIQTKSQNTSQDFYI